MPGNKQHGQHHAGLALPAQGAKVRLRPHGHVPPATRPALQAVDGGRRVDGVEEGHGDERGDEADGGRGEAGDGMGASLASELSIGHDDEHAPSNESLGRPQVEPRRPQLQEEVGRQIRLVVDDEPVGRDAEDGDAGGQGEEREGDAGAVDEAEEAQLGLVLDFALGVLGLDLEVGRGQN
ncbi:hypothetical protein CCMA1212_007309 [Trichoderma ghanense]|uniref:Uncharacterized protein n=1 Tax=Trichoderma ghanense TaxID=65468 RepID=A0ABY2GY04_9HYPO